MTCADGLMGRWISVETYESHRKAVIKITVKIKGKPVFADEARPPEAETFMTDDVRNTVQALVAAFKG